MKKQETKIVTTVEGKLKNLEKEIRRIEKNVPNAAIKEKLALAANGRKLLEEMSAKEEKSAEEYVKKYMLNPALVADPPLHWWFKCLRKPFTASLVKDGKCVKVPYHESLVPRRSVAVPNYGVTTITGSATNKFTEIDLFCGRTTFARAGGGITYHSNPQTLSGVTTYAMGHTLQTTDPYSPCAGYYSQVSAEPVTVYDSANSTAAYIPLPYADRATPFELNKNNNVIDSRPVCMGVKVSWESALADSQGYVEAFLFHHPIESGDGLFQYRVTSQYLGRVFFANRRSAEFTWQPDAHFYKWGTLGSGSATTEKPPQLKLVMFLPTTDSVQVEYIGVVEYHHINEPRVLTKSKQTPHAADVGNAVANQGASKNKDMGKHFIAAKAEAHPIVGRLEKVFKDVGEAVGGYTAVKAALPYAHKIWTGVKDLGSLAGEGAEAGGAYAAMI